MATFSSDIADALADIFSHPLIDSDAKIKRPKYRQTQAVYNSFVIASGDIRNNITEYRHLEDSCGDREEEKCATLDVSKSRFCSSWQSQTQQSESDGDMVEVWTVHCFSKSKSCDERRKALSSLRNDACMLAYKQQQQDFQRASNSSFFNNEELFLCNSCSYFMLHVAAGLVVGLCRVFF